MNKVAEGIRKAKETGPATGLLADQNGNREVLERLRRRLKGKPVAPKPTPSAAQEKPKVLNERDAKDRPFKEGSVEDILFGGLEMARKSGPHPTPAEEIAEQALLSEEKRAREIKKIIKLLDKYEAIPPNEGMKEGQPPTEEESPKTTFKKANGLINDPRLPQKAKEPVRKEIQGLIDNIKKLKTEGGSVTELEAKLGETVARIEHNLEYAKRTSSLGTPEKKAGSVKSPDTLSAEGQLRRLKESQHDAGMSDELRSMVGEKIKQLERELKNKEKGKPAAEQTPQTPAAPDRETPPPAREAPSSTPEGVAERRPGLRANIEDRRSPRQIFEEPEKVDLGRRRFFGLGKKGPAGAAEAAPGKTEGDEIAPQAPAKPRESSARRAETPRGAERKSVAPRTSALGWFMRQMPPGIQVTFLARQESAAREKRKDLERTLSEREHLAQEFFADKKILESRLETAGEEERGEIQAELTVMTSEFEAKRNRDVREAQGNFEKARSVEQELTRQKETVAAQEVRRFADKLDALERRSMPIRKKLDQLTSEMLRIRESNAAASRRRLELLRDTHALGELKFWQVVKKWERWQLNGKISKLEKILEKNEKSLEKRENALSKARKKLEPFENTVAKLEEKRERFAQHLKPNK